MCLFVLVRNVFKLWPWDSSSGGQTVEVYQFDRFKGYYTVCSPFTYTYTHVLVHFSVVLYCVL